MATFFVDYEGGNDASDGTSFATRWKTLTLGATAARIAPGDTIRVMASPDPTSLGVTGAWTDGPLASTQTITSSTNATPIVITKVAHGYLNGDTLIVSGHTTNTNANGTWTVANKTNDTLELQGSVGNGVGATTGTMRKMNNAVVTLASAVNKNIALPVDGGTGGQGSKTNWTASANVTCSVTTADFKQGGECQVIDIAAAFTTGLAAYMPITAVDLSAYQQITFWIKQTAGTIGAAGAVRVRLCSDAAGVTPVDTFDVPNLVSLNVWFPVTVNKGSALGASIQSVSFDVVTDNGAQTFRLDNIVAVKSTSSADSLSLQSLIGKNTAGETWLAIQSISGARVMLDQGQSTTPDATPQRGYSGATETVTTYIRKPIVVTATDSFGVMDSGTIDLPIVYSFGWDMTAMNTRNAESWFTGLIGTVAGLKTITMPKNYFSIEGVVGFSRYATGIQLNHGTGIGIGISFGNEGLHANNNTDSGVYSTLTIKTTGVVASMNNNNNVSAQANQINGANNLRVLAAHGNNLAGILVWGCGQDVSFDEFVAKNNATVGFQGNNEVENIVVRNLMTSGNATAGVSPGGATYNGASLNLHAQSTFYLKNASISETTEVSSAGALSDSRIISENHDLVTGNTQIFVDGGSISSESAVRHTNSGLAWALIVTSTTRSSNYPLRLEIAKVAVAANMLATVSLWLRRTDTGLTLRLMCKGKQIAGVDADVSSEVTAAADTWEQRTITFTPTETGVVSITVEAYGGTTFIGYADDFSASQG